MRIAYLTHSLASCWNHGNAHFLRGVLRELAALGHEVEAHEPEDAWSRRNLLADHGEAGLARSLRPYPELRPRVFSRVEEAVEAVAGADCVIVHEWNEPALVAALGAARRRGARHTLLFHDTHHRAVSDPDAIRAFDLGGYDGVLAFGATLAEVYRRWGWGDRVFVWHEAADTRLFHPPSPVIPGRRAASNPEPTITRSAPSWVPGSAARPRNDGTGDRRNGLVWIGNWGDGERGAELESFLFAPARAVGLPLDVYGVRYPADALATLARHGARHHGWLPNAEAPAVFARHLATVHVPRRFYVAVLPGIPTIRVFEALACGIPLVCAPWDDAEGLFRPGRDYLVARDGAGTERHLAALRDDAGLRGSLVASGLETILSRHTCRHRAQELLNHLATVRGTSARDTVPLEMSA